MQTVYSLALQKTMAGDGRRARKADPNSPQDRIESRLIYLRSFALSPASLLGRILFPSPMVCLDMILRQF
jgi:hypothetical protein